jgi:hypothetical protein
MSATPPTDPSRQARAFRRAPASPLSGRFYVRRVSGVLPPFGVTKHLEGGRGCTYLFGIPFGRFTISGRRFIYDFWPIVDELEPERDDGVLVGRGKLFGTLTFCRFRLELAPARRDELV